MAQHRGRAFHWRRPFYVCNVQRSGIGYKKIFFATILSAPPVLKDPTHTHDSIKQIDRCWLPGWIVPRMIFGFCFYFGGACLNYYIKMYVDVCVGHKVNHAIIVAGSQRRERSRSKVPCTDQRFLVRSPLLAAVPVTRSRSERAWSIHRTRGRRRFRKRSLRLLRSLNTENRQTGLIGSVGYTFGLPLDSRGQSGRLR